MPSSSSSRATLGTVVALVAALAVPAAAQAAEAPAPATAARAAAAGATAAPSRSSVDETVVPRAGVTGFGGGTVYAPRGTGTARLGAVVITPGYLGSKSDMAWYARDLAAQGHVVFTIDTLAPDDYTDKRSAEMLAAVDYLTGSSSVSARVDPARIALIGYSMGGGGALQATESHPAIKAAVALMPFDLPADPASDATTRTYPGITSPTLIITGQRDQVATASTFGKPMYDALPASTPRQYVELAAANHSFGQKTRNITILRVVSDFLERYLDGDASYDSRIFPAPAVKGPLSASLSSPGTPAR
jgi:dienelactone hydrolase